MKLEITKLVADGLYREALCFFSQLHSTSLRTHKFSFPYLLKCCAKLNASPQGQMLHTHLIKTGIQAHIYTATALTDMYMKLHASYSALKVFDEIPEPNKHSLHRKPAKLDPKDNHDLEDLLFKRTQNNDFPRNPSHRGTHELSLQPFLP